MAQTMMTPLSKSAIKSNGMFASDEKLRRAKVSSTNYVFKRKEIKFLINREQHDRLLKLFRGIMCEDEYGLSTICNIYLDTEDFDLIRRSIDRPVYKEKLRLRSYGTPGNGDRVFLEIKKKYKGIVYKRRASMTLWEAKQYLEKGERPEKKKEQIFNELDYCIMHYHPVPKLYLAYDRTAYYCQLDEYKDVRITFDSGIRFRQDDIKLEDGDRGEKLLPDDMYIMEIKIPGAMPLWLLDMLTEVKAERVSFSKYGSIYQKYILPDIMRKVQARIDGRILPAETSRFEGKPEAEEKAAAADEFKTAV